MDKVVQLWFCVLLFACHLAFATTATAADCTPHAATIVSVQGEIEVKRAGTSNWHPVTRNDAFCPGDSIRVGERSRAAIVMANETLLRLDQNSAIKFTRFETEAPSILGFIRGIGHFISRVPRSLKIETATVDAAIEGTEFVVAVSADETRVTVFEGTVQTRNEQGEMRITDGETVIVSANAAPRKTLLAKPRDTVQWALYFPPVIAMEKPDNVSRASQLLAVGRVEEAQSLVQGIDSGEALALQTVIAIVNNEQERAFNFATEAVKRAPRSAAAHIAMSYAWQAKLNLDQALASARLAVEYEPGNAIAWARLAELQLSTGELNESLAAAQHAIQQDATLSRTQSILGFAYLARIEINEAMAVFNKAIELDQVDPLPRLGLGLARIRKSNLDDGRREIEIATSLDPNNAIIRSYLGKAYYEEKRNELAEDQYDMAKGLDPNDPTPWFYAAILKQSVNRPVEALHDIERSIQLNNNRSVFRSTLLLDEDEAARNASQGRIYNNLGFQQRGLLEGWKSVNTDPGNHSGHRLLADTYAALPRHEVARVSELLQSQLLQPLNTNPIQPQLAEANLGILSGTGPTSLSTTEFNPMFTRNGVGVQFDGVVGSNSTLGNNLILSGLHDRVSYSLGQFHYETDGFRENNDLTQNIYNAFVQGSLSPSTSIQAEYRYRNADHGDLAFLFDPDMYSPVERYARRRNTGRLGLNHHFSPNGQLLASLIYHDSHVERNETQTEQRELPPDIPLPPGFPPAVTVESIDIDTIDSEGYTAELQYLGYTRALNFVAGAGRFDEDQHVTEYDSEIVTPPIFPEPMEPSFTSLGIETVYKNAYIYTYPEISEEVTLTLGVSIDDLESIDIARDELNPKLGLMWKGVHGTTVRAAYFEGIGRPYNADQTIEPTQVAGFNQFFDDLAGSATKRYGVALEQRFNPDVFSGIELTWRDLEAVAIVTGDFGRATLLDDRDEQFHRAYIYWTPTKRMAFSTEYFYEKEEGEVLIPFKLVTHRAPVGISYFWHAGYFVDGIATYVDQEYTGQTGTADDQFWIADLAVGYRLPRRRGILQLVVKNMLDEKFNYFDPAFRTLARVPRGPVFAPERQVFAQLSLSFR